MDTNVMSRGAGERWEECHKESEEKRTWNMERGIYCETEV